MHLSFTHTYTHAQTDLQSAVHQHRQNYAAEAATRLPLFDVLEGFMCEACHASPHELKGEYIYATKLSFDTNHAKSCPSRGEGSTESAVAVRCHFQALCSNKSIKPSNMFARLGPAIGGPLAAQGSAEEAKAQRAFARTLVQTSNGDLRSRQGAQGRGSVASLATDGSDAYHFHDVNLTQLRVIDFLRSCVTDMDDFHNLFAKAGHSSLSTTSSLGEHEQHFLADAVFTFLDSVNARLSDTSLETGNLIDAVGDREEKSEFRKQLAGVKDYASASAALVLAVVRRADFDLRQKDRGIHAGDQLSDLDVKEAALFSKLPPFPPAVMEAAERLRASVMAQAPRVVSADAGEESMRQARERADVVLVPLVHTLLERLFHRDVQVDDMDSSCCPVRAHMIAQLWTGRAGGFGPVSGFTTKIIHLKFLARATTFHSIISDRSLTREAKAALLKYVQTDLPGLSSTPFQQLAKDIKNMRTLAGQEVNKVKAVPYGNETYAVNGKMVIFPSVRHGLADRQQDSLDLLRAIVAPVPADILARFRCARRMGWGGGEPYEVKEDVSSSGTRDVGYYFGCQGQILLLHEEVVFCLRRALLHDVGGSVEISLAKAEELINLCDKLTDNMLWSTYTGSGNPCRGSEIAARQLRDAQLACRNTFVYQGVLMHTEGNIKQTSMTGRAGEGARFLDPFNSDVFIDYLALIRPFYDFLCQLVFGRRDVNALYVRQGRPCTHDDVLSLIKNGFRTYAKLDGVGVREYRQATEALVREDLGPLIQEEHLLAHLGDDFRKVLADASGEEFVATAAAQDLQVHVLCLFAWVMFPFAWPPQNTHTSSFFPPSPHQQANHSARTANAVYGNTGRGIGNKHLNQIDACFKFSQIFWRKMGTDDGSFERRREKARLDRERLGKNCHSERELWCLILILVKASHHENRRNNNEPNFCRMRSNNR
jgi:hypothetical protein